MTRGSALLLCVLSQACLDAPSPGDGDEGGDPSPDGPGGPGEAGGADGGVPCESGASGEVVFVSRFEAPIGESELEATGFLLVANTGDLPLDASQLTVGPAAVQVGAAFSAFAVDQAGGMIQPGEVTGLWGFDDELIDETVREAWTDTSRPAVDISLDYLIAEEAALRLLVPVTLGDLSTLLTIDVLVTGLGSVRAIESARLSLVCATQ